MSFSLFLQGTKDAQIYRKMSSHICSCQMYQQIQQRRRNVGQLNYLAIKYEEGEEKKENLLRENWGVSIHISQKKASKRRYVLAAVQEAPFECCVELGHE